MPEVQCESCDKMFDRDAEGRGHDPVADVYCCPDCMNKWLKELGIARG